MVQFSLLDKVCLGIDQALRALCHTETSTRVSPAQAVADVTLNAAEARLSAGLMRVNHTGEICAQALYQGQSLTARLPDIRFKMEQAAKEEYDHLAWCKQRITAMNSHTSYLNPLWYTGSFLIGAIAGAVGDKWSLGFVAETERQVVEHLTSHQHQLPQADLKSHAVVRQMQLEEEQHQIMAHEAGAAELPKPIKHLMRITAKIMTKTAFWI